MLSVVSFCGEKLNLRMFYIFTLASVANATKVCCVQKIKGGGSCPVAKEGMLNSRVSTDCFLLWHRLMSGREDKAAHH